MPENSKSIKLSAVQDDIGFWQTSIHLFLKDLDIIEGLLLKLSAPQKKMDSGKVSNRMEEMVQLRQVMEGFSHEIERHEVEMKGLLECEDILCEETFQERHLQMESQFKKKMGQLLYIKSDILGWLDRHISN